MKNTILSALVLLFLIFSINYQVVAGDVGLAIGGRDGVSGQLGSSGHQFNDGGAVIGDGAITVTLVNGEKVPADFVSSFPIQDDELPPHLTEFNFKKKYPKVFKELENLVNFASTRARSNKSEVIDDLLYHKGYHSKKEKSHYYLTENDEPSCKMVKSKFSYTREVVKESKDACSYVIRKMNPKTFEVQTKNVVEIRKEVMESSEYSNRMKALIILHENLHFYLATTKAKYKYPDAHVLIHPFIRDLNLLYNISLKQIKSTNLYKNRKAHNRSINDLYKLSENEMTVAESFQYVFEKLLDLKYPSHASFPFVIAPGGGIFVAHKIFEPKMLDRKIETSYIDLSSIVYFTKYQGKSSEDWRVLTNEVKLFDENVIINSLVQSDNIDTEKTTFIDSYLRTKLLKLSESEILSTKFNDWVYDTDYDLSCTECKIESSVISESNIVSIKNLNIFKTRIHDTNISAPVNDSEKPLTFISCDFTFLGKIEHKATSHPVKIKNLLIHSSIPDSYKAGLTITNSAEKVVEFTKAFGYHYIENHIKESAFGYKKYMKLKLGKKKNFYKHFSKFNK